LTLAVFVALYAKGEGSEMAQNHYFVPPSQVCMPVTQEVLKIF